MSERNATLPSASPCVGVCRLDPGGRRCVGCGRSMAEIAAWPGLTEVERAAILQRLAAEKP